MPYTFEELKSKTLVDLRDLARNVDAEAVKGWSQMNKDHLLPLLAKALGVDTHVHAHVEGVDKNGLKAKLRQLAAQRDEALAAHDEARLKAIRRQRHHLNGLIRRHTHLDS